MSTSDLQVGSTVNSLSALVLDVPGTAAVIHCSHLLAGSTQLKTTMLQDDYAYVITSIREKVAAATNITVNLDGWSDNTGHSVYACNVIFSDRTMAQFAVEDFSDDSHTGAFIAGASLLHRSLRAETMRLCCAGRASCASD